MRKLAVVLWFGLAVWAFAQEYDANVLLAGNRAKLVSTSTSDALESDRELVRSWDHLSPRYVEGLAGVLRGRRTESNPQADLRTYSGTWRVAKVMHQREKDGSATLFETLRFGLATTLAEDEARLGEWMGDPLGGEYGFRRFWPYVDPQAADTLLVALSASTIVTNPQADAQTYTGEFGIGRVTSRRLEDGAIEISQNAKRIFRATNTTDLSNLDYRKMQDHEIIKLFGLDSGTGQVYGIIWDSMVPDNQTRTNCMEKITDAQLVSKFASGWSYSDRKWREKRDGSASFAVAFQKRTWDNAAGSSPNKVPKTTNVVAWVNYDPENATEGYDTKKGVIAQGIPIADLQQIRDNIEPESGYALDNIRMRDDGNGSGTVSWEQTKTRQSNEEVVVSFQAAYGRQPEVEKVVWLNLTSADADIIYNDATNKQSDLTASGIRASPASHKLNTVTKNPNPNGLFRLDRVSWKPTNTGNNTWPESSSTYTTYYIGQRRHKGQWHGGKIKEYTWHSVWRKDVKYHATLAAAWGEFQSDITNVYLRTGVQRIGDRKYVSTKIRTIPVGTAVTNVVGTGVNQTITNETWYVFQ